MPKNNRFLVRIAKVGLGGRVFESGEITNAIVIKYSEHFSQLFKSLGIHNFTFHSLRRSFSSLLQTELGTGTVIVQGMTGYSSLGMLQKCPTIKIHKCHKKTCKSRDCI